MLGDACSNDTAFSSGTGVLGMFANDSQLGQLHIVHSVSDNRNYLYLSRVNIDKLTRLAHFFSLWHQVCRVLSM